MTTRRADRRRHWYPACWRRSKSLIPIPFLGVFAAGRDWHKSGQCEFTSLSTCLKLSYLRRFAARHGFCVKPSRRLDYFDASHFGAARCYKPVDRSAKTHEEGTMSVLAFAAPVLMAAAGYSLLYLLMGGGLGGAILIFIVAKMLGK